MPRPPRTPFARRSRRGLATAAAAFALAAVAPRPVRPEEPTVPDPDPWLRMAGASLAGVSDDGSVVAFRRQHEGVAQLFRTDARGSAPVLVTKRKDPVDFAVLSPDGTRAVVGYDAGGDENDGLHLVGVGPGRDGEERTLSAVPGVQHGGVVWSRDGKRVFFRSNGTSRADFHLHEMQVDDGAVRTVLARQGSWNVHDVDPAGKRLLVGHFRSARDSSIHLLDLETGALRDVAANRPKGRGTSDGQARFLGDGGAAVFLSDRSAAGLRWPYVVTLATDEVRELVRCGDSTPRGCTGCPRDVDSVDPARDGRSVVVVENQGGRSVPFAVDVETGVERAPAPSEPAVLGSVAVDAKGRAYATVADAVRPSSVAAWDGAAGTPWRTLVPGDLAGVPPSALPAPPREVSYPTFDGRSIPAWLHLPPGATGPIPFVVSVHGGPEGQARPTFVPDRAYLQSLGYGVLAPNVRGSTGYGREWRDLDDYRKRLDSVRDVKAAAEWLAKEGLAPKDRIAVMGGSYGGYVVLACLTEFPDVFAAGVDVVGIANFETFLERTAPYRRALREAEYGPLTDREFLRSISPIHKVDRIRAPLLVAHGENDPRVPVHEARQIEEALRARGTPVRALYFPDEGHGWQKRENRATYLRAVAEFLRETLGPSAPPPSK